MARSVEYHANFVADLRVRVSWLRQHRPAERRAKWREALTKFNARVAAFPALGREVERRGSVAYCVRPLGDPLPYLVWCSYDTADPNGPLSLLMLLHEAQDRERFDPSEFS